MAHYYTPTTSLQRPSSFNFAVDVVDYWAKHAPPDTTAMHWISQERQHERRLGFEHFSRQSHRLAVLLCETLSVRQTDRLMLIMPRVPEWWEIATACLRSGVVVCPATTLLVDKDVEFRCNRSGASVFVGDGANVEKFLRVRGNCPTVKHIIQVGAGPFPSEVISLSDAMSSIAESAVFDGPQPDIKAPAMIYFTSGTTGYPKMVLHNHISYPLAHVITGKHFLRLQPGQLCWVLSEQGWAKAAWAWFGAWNCGAGLFIHDDRQPFSAQRTLDVLHNYPITTFCAPPTAYRQLVLDDMRAYYATHRPKALKHCTGAGEPLNPEVIRLWKETSGIEICDGYGQTETVLVCGNFEGNPIRPGSMGKPSPGVPLHIVDENGMECNNDVEGDIALQVDLTETSSFFGLFDGYLDAKGSLDRRLRTSNNPSAKQWYLTGDRVTRDKEGYFWFVGRSDDVINSSGYRIGPFEVESTLKQHPAVVESAVVSSPDSSRGEVVKAFVVLTPQAAQRDSQSLVQELQGFCKTNAAPYKYPRKIQFVDAAFLPKTISGKIQRKKLKEMEWAADGGVKAKL
ncbi:Hypothetical protein R9X50_00310500 [Acrodontium crateriforme]|uniref:medium-chain acyl-CoA ligase n=1 Tax=Acrodontium crateriforme TaxID=150365 RepID=A0AAQ3M5K7_9PEZI|nr:Hypothetical protein R9X50_00310500 [Acrodontium crateriforme]